MDTERALAQTLCAAYPDEAARLLERLAPAAVAPLFTQVSAEAAASVLCQLAPSVAADALGRLAPAEAGPILGALPLDEAARLLRQIDPGARAALVDAAPAAAAQALAALLRYPEGSAGALMDPRALAALDDWSAGTALERLRQDPHLLRHYLYVVTREHGRLVGVLSLRMLLLADPAAPLESIMVSEVERVAAEAGATALLAHPAWRRFPLLPVVDAQGTFAGVVRYETVRRLAAAAETAGPERGAVATVMNLGELWWIGLAGAIAGLAASVTGPPTEGGKPGR